MATLAALMLAIESSGYIFTATSQRLRSALASERGAFDFNTVLNEICVKLITRHTHVFGDVKTDGVEGALTNWEANKKKEKNIKNHTDNLKDVPMYLPALMRAEKVQKRAASVGFDFNNAIDAIKELEEEISELKTAIAEGTNISEEFGDVLFSAANVARHIGVDGEIALSDSVEKFIARFSRMEQEAMSKNRDLDSLNLEEMDEIWGKIK